MAERVDLEKVDMLLEDPTVTTLRDQLDSAKAEVERLREALKPFAAIAERDIGATEDDADLFRPMYSHNVAPNLTLGDFRRARSALGDEA